MTSDLSLNVTKLRQIAPRFNSFLEAEGADFRSDRAKKDLFFAETFSRAALADLDEGRLRQLVYNLWSFNGWTNKDYVVQQMLQSGLPRIREALEKLVHGPGTIAERFDAVRGVIRFMGGASISEMLAHTDHDRFPIWNARSRQGLRLLGISDSQIPGGGQPTGAQYELACALMQRVRAEVVKHIPLCTDLFELDLLLYFLSREEEAEAPPVIESPSHDLNHTETIELLLELGDGLGFEVEKEYPVTAGCRIDVIWRTRVANLGTIGYAFEVQRRGSRDSAILNLQRVRRDRSIQKVILVSSAGELDTFRREIASLDEAFRQAVGYLEVGLAQRTLEHVRALKATLNDIGLLAPVGGES